MMRRTELKRKSFWNPPRKPLQKENPERRAKVAARRRRQRSSPEEKEARRIARERANGVCECGCGLPFDKSDGQYGPDYPEFHHLSYGKHEGQYLRRQCHHRIEFEKHGHRHTTSKRRAS